MGSSALAVLGAVGLVAVIGYQFIGISVLCDEYLCPALDEVCEKLKMPRSLAGATLVAFGSSAPELIISMGGALSDATELSVPTILTSGLIAFALIPPLVVLSVGPIELKPFGVLRDAAAYAISLGLLIAFSGNSSITSTQDVSLIMLYVVYLVVVYVTERRGSGCASDESDSPDDAADAGAATLTTTEGGRRSKGYDGGGGGSSQLSVAGDAAAEDDEAARLRRRAAGPAGSEGAPLLGRDPSSAAGGGAGDDGTDDDAESVGASDKGLANGGDGGGGVLSCACAALHRPFELVLGCTIPAPARAPLGALGTSMVWLALLSMGALYGAEALSDLLGFSEAAAGMTLLAFGGQIPDTIAAIELARGGMADAAISQAIASQVINVSLGLGLPFLLYSALSGEPTETENYETVVTIGVAVSIAVGMYVLVVVLHVARARLCALRSALVGGGDKCGATAVLGAADVLGGGDALFRSAAPSGDGADDGGTGGAAAPTDTPARAYRAPLACITKGGAIVLAAVFGVLYVGCLVASVLHWSVL